ncbi:hypothetical protein GS397_00815 [Sphingobium yanoikuyae]|uniref:Uncharacterized protein n=1 Tax=Sphingobium yanoikuyae TaxID=13690 RepID=A0A6P1GBS0_SPHYA|nr:hypothetical protein [Sphingobium yanoikuyae]QHD65752.1 hypothetical protein GS397_00815 [Sphingobium yanoikuyae]
MLEETPEKVTFSYIKSNQFRVMHVDGALGGITPQGHLHVALYSERPSIPKVMVHSVEGNVLGPPEAVEGRGGIVREIDADLIMTMQVVEELRDWLNLKLEEFAQLKANGDAA